MTSRDVQKLFHPLSAGRPGLATAALPMLCAAPPSFPRSDLVADVPTRSSQLDVHDMMLCNFHMH